MATYQARVLVIANKTADAPELLAALQARHEKGPMVPTLLMPATRNGFAGKEEAGERLETVLTHWREAGLSARREAGGSAAGQGGREPLPPPGRGCRRRPLLGPRDHRVAHVVGKRAQLLGPVDDERVGSCVVVRRPRPRGPVLFGRHSQTIRQVPTICNFTTPSSPTSTMLTSPACEWM